MITGVEDDEDVRADVSWWVREKDETMLEIRFPRRLVNALDLEMVPWLEDEAIR